MAAIAKRSAPSSAGPKPVRPARIAGKADAQIVYGYSNVPVNGGFSSNRTVVGVGGYQTYNSFYSPFTNSFQTQSYGTNMFGQTYGRMNTYNGWNGFGFNTQFYRPNYFAPVYGGYNYGFYGRPWGWGW